MDKIIGLNRVPNDLKVEPKITKEWTHPNDNKKRLEEYRTLKILKLYLSNHYLLKPL